MKANQFTVEKMLAIEKVAKGEYVKRTPDAQKVYIRGDYDRATKSYECQDTEDMSRFIYIKSGKEVFIGFEY